MFPFEVVYWTTTMVGTYIPMVHYCSNTTHPNTTSYHYHFIPILKDVLGGWCRTHYASSFSTRGLHSWIARFHQPFQAAILSSHLLSHIGMPQWDSDRLFCFMPDGAFLGHLLDAPLWAFQLSAWAI